MKTKLIRSMIIVILAEIVLISGTVHGKSGSQDVTVLYGGIRILVDNIEIELEDARGDSVKPFILNDTTYLPIRAIAGALHMEVEWDEATHSVYLANRQDSTEAEQETDTDSDESVTDTEEDIGFGSSAASISEIAVEKTITITYRNLMLIVNGDFLTPEDANGNVIEPFVCDGTTYLPVRTVGEAVGKPVYWEEETVTVYIGEMDMGDEAQ